MTDTKKRSQSNKTYIVNYHMVILYLFISVLLNRVFPYNIFLILHGQSCRQQLVNNILTVYAVLRIKVLRRQSNSMLDRVQIWYFNKWYICLWHLMFQRFVTRYQYMWQILELNKLVFFVKDWVAFNIIGHIFWLCYFRFTAFLYKLKQFVRQYDTESKFMFTFMFT